MLHVPKYLPASRADVLLRWALADVHWHQEQIRLFGRWVPVPRLVAWFGDAGARYRYSGVDHQATGWPAVLEELRAELAGDFGFCSNFVLLNRYRSGTDSMGWHADDEAELVGPVMSLSLGSARHLLMRSRRGPAARLNLDHGALLMLPPELYHALPKTRRPTGQRVNLTFRQVRAA